MKSLLQTKEWANFRVSQGWQAHEIDGIFILERQMPFAPKGSLWEKSFLYAPEVEWASINLDNFLRNLEKIAQSSHSIFFRLEILDEFDEEIIEKLKVNKFVKAFEELQPEWRQIIDISQSEQDLLAQMKEKGRYNIKIAQREGVVIKSSKKIDDFYKIFIETAKRDGFSIRPRNYFEKMFEILGENVELLIAEFQGKIIAAEIVTFYENTASYLYGASSSENRNVMAPYLLHWEAIKRAKEKGCKYYDLLAVNPGDVDRSQSTVNRNEENSVNGERLSVNHKYSGITRFKEQFGGRKVHITGSYDLVFKPTWYKLFKTAEKYRRK